MAARVRGALPLSWHQPPGLGAVTVAAAAPRVATVGIPAVEMETAVTTAEEMAVTTVRERYRLRRGR
jgi:hypothetical protein